MNKTTTQTQSATSAAINITSKHFINQLESVIIQIARCLSIEHQIPVDPDAKEMTRRIVQMRLNTLLKNDIKDSLKELKEETTNLIRNAKHQETKDLAIKTYNLLTLVDLDNVD